MPPPSKRSLSTTEDEPATSPPPEDLLLTTFKGAVETLFPKEVIEEVGNQVPQDKDVLYADFLVRCAALLDAKSPADQDSILESVPFRIAVVLFTYVDAKKCSSSKGCDSCCQVYPDADHSIRCRRCNTERGYKGRDRFPYPYEADKTKQPMIRVNKKELPTGFVEAMEKFFEKRSIDNFQEVQTACKEFNGGRETITLGVENVVVAESLPNSKDFMTARETLGRNFCPILVQICVEGMGLEEGTDFNKEDVENLVENVLNSMENPKLSFDFDESTKLFGGLYWNLFWSVVHLLDLIEAAASFGLFDVLGLSLLCESLDGTADDLFMDTCAANAYLVHTFSRTAANKAIEKAQPQQVRDRGFAGTSPDRTPVAPVNVGMKTELLKSLIPTYCRCGFNPKYSPTELFRKRGNELGKLLSIPSSDPSRNQQVETYIEELFDGAGIPDERVRDIIIDSIKDCIVNTQESAMPFPLFLAAYIGMLMKAVLFHEDGPLRTKIAKQTGFTGRHAAQFCDGYRGERMSVVTTPVRTYEQFEVGRKGVVSSVFTLATHAFAPGKVYDITSVGFPPVDSTIALDLNAVWSFNATESSDLLSGGTTPSEKMTMVKSISQCIALHPDEFVEHCNSGTIVDLGTAKRELQRLHVPSIRADMFDSMETDYEEGNNGLIDALTMLAPEAARFVRTDSLHYSTT